MQEGADDGRPRRQEARPIQGRKRREVVGGSSLREVELDPPSSSSDRVLFSSSRFSQLPERQRPELRG